MQRKPYWIIKRKTAYYVKYRDRPNKLLSTGTLDKEQAEIWAIEHMHDKPQKPLCILRQFTEDFFIPGKCEWLKRREKKDQAPGLPTLKSWRRNLVNYILPAWGDYILPVIHTRELDDWLLDLTDFRTGEPLSNQTKNHIRHVLKIIFQDAKDQQLIDENPVNEIKPFKPKWKKRDILTDEEIKKMFPVDREKLLSIWGGQMWAAFFLIASVTGLRPGEILALRWSDWYRSLHGMIVSRTIEDGGRIKEKLKEDKQDEGKIKPVLLTDRTEQELILWESKSKFSNPGDLIFCRTQGKPLNRKGISRRFHLALQHEHVKLDPAGRNLVPYSLRHGFDTDMLKRAPMHIVQTLMGHSTDKMTRLYNHPNPEDLLKTVLPARDLIEERWKTSQVE